MRYALISDIHSNLEALEAVRIALASEDIDEYLCVGDVVGYGADPHAVMGILQSLAPSALVAGNHDWGALGLTDLEYFNEYAKAAIEWTIGLLNKPQADYLKSFSLVYEAEDFTLVHGSLDEPAEFNYILNSFDAYRTMKMMKKGLCFVGHSHIAGIFYANGNRIERLKGLTAAIDRSKKYVVNVGSVGQPRDGDSRASFAIYDSKESTVEIKRIEYDIETAQKKILDSGLPKWLASRLSEGI